MNNNSISVVFADSSHAHYAQRICDLIYESALQRGTGIAKRSPEYIAAKMTGGKAVVALDGEKLIGFSYIECWGHGDFVATSGLIVDPEYRHMGLAERIKRRTFEQGEIAAVNGRPYADKVEAIRAVEAVGSKFGIGRDMHIGDTIIGIKGRVGFEAAAPILIIAAHRMLEKHTQTKWQIYWKEQVANWYGMFLHEAQYLEPVMRDIEAMLASSQRNVTGTVELILRPYSYTLVGVDSTFDLMKTDFGEYGEVNKAWTADDVKGFTKILGNQMKIYYNVQARNGKAKK